ncbi:hypothetical protein [Krasilnikovia sp. M28-CT-15]|uniref:hypothetical protein n=1 Tax=Krasilnikovia sp. M28-CT-15 TaxID=3373540 RepID=UPI003876FAF7
MAGGYAVTTDAVVGPELEELDYAGAVSLEHLRSDADPSGFCRADRELLQGRGLANRG